MMLSWVSGAGTKNWWWRSNKEVDQELYPNAELCAIKGFAWPFIIKFGPYVSRTEAHPAGISCNPGIIFPNKSVRKVVPVKSYTLLPKSYDTLWRSEKPAAALRATTSRNSTFRRADCRSRRDQEKQQAHLNLGAVVTDSDLFGYMQPRFHHNIMASWIRLFQGIIQYRLDLGFLFVTVP